MSTAPILALAGELAIVAAASALQAATGMGMALLAAPLLALIDPSLVPGPMLCTVVVLSIAVAWRERHAVSGQVVGLGLAGLLLGAAIGAGILRLLFGLDLAPVFAVLILAMVAVSVSGVRIDASRPALLLGGAASGVVGTMFGVHGPPIALVLQHERPERMRATLCAFFAVGCTLSLLALAAIGAFGAVQIGQALRLVPAVAVGLLVAPFISRRIDRQRARVAVLVISTLSALALLLR